MRLLIVGVVGVVGVVVLSGCSNGQTGTVKRDAGIYAAVITAAVADHTSPGTTFDRPVYVAGTVTNRIGLEVQAKVVEQLSAIAIRFVDSRDEAIDASAAGDPVLHDGLLLTLGKIAAVDDSRTTVQVQTYRGAGTDASQDDVVQQQGGRWVVTGTSPAAP